MRALAVDTSTNMCGVAVANEQGLLAEILLNDGKTHSHKLIPMLHQLLSNLGLNPADINVYAAITGPGSFTGLRIGVTTIKTIAYAARKPVAGITSLDALAYTAIPSEDDLVCPMLDARNNQVYTAIYKYRNGVMSNISGYMAVHINELVKKLEESNARVIFTGDGAAIHADFLKIELGNRYLQVPEFMLRNMAAPAAMLALAQALRGETVDSFELAPFYLRRSQAEREYEKKHGGQTEDT